MDALKRARRCAGTPGRLRERGFLLLNWSAETVQWAARACVKALRRGLGPVACAAGPRSDRLPFAASLHRMLAGRGGPRRYLRPGLTPADFAQEMNRRGVRYVVLRWWQDFPNLPVGEDMDLLVADEDFDRIDDLFTDYPAGTTCDVYSVIVTEKGDLFSVDYEFLQPYRDPPPSLDKAYEVIGVPTDFAGDLPVWAGREDCSFDRTWRPFIGSWRDIKQLCA